MPLHFFDCSDGLLPSGQVSSRRTTATWYGTTSGGGAGNTGTIFRIATGGVHATLHSFASDCQDGCFPDAGLVQARDGKLYGASQPGPGGRRCIFNIGAPMTA